MSDILTARVDVMQKEIHGVLSAVNKDFHTVVNHMMAALQAMDARVTVLEDELRARQEEAKPVALEPARDGVEL